MERTEKRQEFRDPLPLNQRAVSDGGLTKSVYTFWCHSSSRYASADNALPKPVFSLLQKIAFGGGGFPLAEYARVALVFLRFAGRASAPSDVLLQQGRHALYDLGILVLEIGSFRDVGA